MTFLMKNLKTIIEMVSENLKPYFMEDNQSDVKDNPDTKSTFESSTTKVKPFSVFAAIVNGVGVGLLLGLLVGLSISPVVSGVIGTLSSLLVIMLGLNDKFMGTVKSFRVGAFGIFAVAGILLGMYIRTNNSLSPPMEEVKKEYLSTGFEENQALYFTALHFVDYVPIGWFGTSEKDTIAMTAAQPSMRSHLFSSQIDVGQCAVLKSADRDFPKSEIVNSFEAAGGIWKDLALNLGSEFPDVIFIDALLAIRDGFCGLGQSGVIEIKSSEKLILLSESNSLESIIGVMNESGESWSIILENTIDDIPKNYQKPLYLKLIKLLSNEETN